MIELEIDSIRVNLRNYQRVVILREKNAERYLPIWIGPTEADAIAYRLQDVSVARPQTHDLLSNMIEQLGASVRSVVVNEMTNDIYYARINSNRTGAHSKSTLGLRTRLPWRCAPKYRSTSRMR